MALDPVIGGVLGSVGSLLGAGIDMYQQDRINQQNLELMKYQNNYNSPKNQMARYRDAGLNPHLIYGNGQASSGNMASAPEMKPYQGGSTGARNAVQSMIDGVQAGNIQADTLLKKESAETEQLRQLGMITSNEISSYNRDTIRATLDAKINEILAETRRNTAEAEDYLTAADMPYESRDRWYARSGVASAHGTMLSRAHGADSARFNANISRVESVIADKFGEQKAKFAIKALRAAIRRSGASASLDEIEANTLTYFDKLGLSNDANAIMKYIIPMLSIMNRK